MQSTAAECHRGGATPANLYPVLVKTDKTGETEWEGQPNLIYSFSLQNITGARWFQLEEYVENCPRLCWGWAE